ncbi:Cullin-domain-containing protein [Guyanagaster necrorhizus]|uniref:Cullin-domain-containing protein n=1 Tax=Guyanagaster necrorhizus TaxID=856835 RepID=A0A9P7VJ78_9AGAR|nr:Cullin-domain-containing protein [Guyanagaster necrorhizus MCA 3950]KAG7442123.1 Cullin-domain-containing protein [Guyanagaster necrorhizus MCA 3950]
MEPSTTSSADRFAQIPFKTADLEETWAFLNPGVDHIMSNLLASLTFANYTNLYTVIYNYCSTKAPVGIGDNKSNDRSNRSISAGRKLYQKIIEYFTTHVASMKQTAISLQGEELLQYYASEWLRYTTGAYYLNRLFSYLNRQWIEQQRCEWRKEMYPVYLLSLVQWKSQFFHFIQTDNQKLVNAVLRLIERQRNGDMIDQGLVKKVVLSFVSLGLDNTDLNKECLEVYKEHFEPPFILATEQYYKKESEAFLAENTISDYLKKAEERLREEEDRVERYLHTKTRKELIQKCEELLDFDQDEDLQRMYSLLSRISDGLDPLRKRFEVHVKQAGLSAISKLVGEGSTVDVDPKVYVDALLDVHQKNSETVTRSFRGEAGFVASLDKSCKKFVNCNAATGSSWTKSPELLAKHADILLRKNNKMAEGDLESTLNRVMVLFNYLEDKDVFRTFYTTKLSKRLIQGVSASDESETSMILKLKEACGFEYTNELQRMFTDMSLSKDLTDSFKKWMAQNHDDMDMTFTVMVLSTNLWPLHPPTHGFTIPIEIMPTYERFTKYYQSRHSGRKLRWLWNHSKNELQTTYLNQKYILMTSAYQMAVLVQYNRNDTLSLDALSAATAISKDILSQVLALLVKAKILVNEEKGQYDLNPGFKSKKIRVNLNQPIKAEVKAESSDVLKAVDEDRKYVIQTTIVRIMKARKTMKNQALIQEVISQISQRFVPKIPDIQKAVETLLEKEYMERVDGQKDTFTYVA